MSLKISIVTTFPKDSSNIEEGTLIKLNSSDNTIPSGLYLYEPPNGWVLYATGRPAATQKLSYLEMLDMIELLIDMMPEDQLEEEMLQLEENEEEEVAEDDEDDGYTYYDAQLSCPTSVKSAELFEVEIDIPNKLISDNFKLRLISEPKGIDTILEMKRGVAHIVTHPLHLDKRGTYELNLYCFNNPEIIFTYSTCIIDITNKKQ